MFRSQWYGPLPLKLARTMNDMQDAVLTFSNIERKTLTMTSKSIVLLAIILLLSTSFVGAVTEKDFEAKTTKAVINLCTVPADNPLYHQAINFCHGFLLGAYRYYEAQSSGPEGVELVCMPDPEPSRNEVIGMFIEWVKARPQYWEERAVETEFRFLAEKWPCKN